MSEFTVRLQVTGDVASLEWDGATDVETLSRAVQLASEDACAQRGVRRLQVMVPASDMLARRALQMAGFRREGIARSAMAVSDGQFVDVHSYGRLAADEATGAVAFSSVMNTVLPTKRMIGHVLFRNGVGDVLLLETSYKSDWELPGGVVEEGEPPRVGAEREVLEELGLDVSLGAPALVDWLPPYLGWGDAMEFIYDGGTLSESTIASLVREEHEISALHWVAPDRVAEHVTPLSARRISLLVQGFRGFTEDGVPLQS